MQGNQFIANFGLQGAEAAGNAYWQGAQGQAQGMLGQGAAWANALGNAAGQIGGGMMMNNPWSSMSPGVRSDMGTGLLPYQNYPMVPGFGGSGGISIPGIGGGGGMPGGFY
jgi:hypothetical protein